LIGIEHFYLFENANTDNYMEVLKPYIDSGVVELFHEPAICTNQTDYLRVQYACYKKAVGLALMKAKWLAILDSDEFIVPLRKKKLITVLNDYENYGGVYVNWVVFGTANVEKIPKDRLLIEVLDRSAPKTSNLGKSIVRPERVKDIKDPHRIFYRYPYIHVNTNYKTFDWVCPIADDKLVIHHYNTRDIDFMMNVKLPRLRNWKPIDMDKYMEYVDLINSRPNKTMRRFIPALRKRMFGEETEDVD
jgi:hypothetical protein